MSLAVSLLMIANAASSGGMIRFRDVAVPSTKALRLGDVADLSFLPPALRARAATLPVIDRQHQGGATAIAHAAIAARARSRMPALAQWLAGPYTGALRFEPTTSRPQFYAVSADSDGIAKGAVVTFRMHIRPVTIERRAIAMQDSKFGERLFVKTSDGVVSVQCCESE